jgi:lipid-binding SYLF domain-containing protein
MMQKKLKGVPRKGWMAAIGAAALVLVSAQSTEVQAAAGAAPVSQSEQALAQSVNAAIGQFKAKGNNANLVLDRASGLLVCPDVIKIGFLVGGHFGNCALRVGSNTVGYYNTTGGAVGLVAGVESKTVIVAFMTPEALANFRSSGNWTAGVDGSISVFQAGTGASVNTLSGSDPIIGFVFNQKGLMADVSLTGSKYTKIGNAPAAG